LDRRNFSKCFAQRHDLSISGLQKEQIIICLELLNQEGIIGGADAAYKRYTLRTNKKVKLKTG
jgi:hypothetical protein